MMLGSLPRRTALYDALGTAVLVGLTTAGLSDARLGGGP